MATKKKTTSKKATEVQASVSPEVKGPTVKTAKDELVAEANINVEIEKDFPKNDESPKKEKDFSLPSTVTVINTSYNEILLNTGRPGANIRIAPKEIKSVDRYLLRELLQNKIVRRWFDKGNLTSNYDSNETTANEAEAPEYLKAPVERTDSVSTISAQVTKFKKDGKVEIKL